MNPPPPSHLSDSGGHLLIKVYVQPRASKNRVVGIHNGELKIALTAPPVDNAANEGLVKLISELLSVPKSAVAVRTGLTSRHKTVAVAGKTVAEALAAFG